MTAKVRNVAQGLTPPQAPAAYDQQNEAMFRLGITQADAQNVKRNDGSYATAGAGVAAGGLTGEVLAKTSASDYDTDWITLATVATSGSAADLTGMLAAAQMPALTGDVHSSAGSTATLLASVSAAAMFPTVGAVARSLLDKIGELVSMEDFGAVGDGVTDDSPAFTAAAAYLKGIGGGILRGGRGKNYVLGGVYIPTNVRFIGTGSDSCQITIKAGSAFVIGNEITASNPVAQSLGFSGFTINGNSTALYGFWNQGAQYVSFSDLLFKNFTATTGAGVGGTLGAIGIYHTGYNGIHGSHWHMDRVRSSFSTNGCIVDQDATDTGTGGAGFGYAVNCAFEDYTQHGVYVRYGEGCCWVQTRCTTRYDRTYGWRMADAKQVMVNCGGDGAMSTSYVRLLTGTTGSIKISIAGTDLTPSPVSFTTDLPTTAAAVVAAINANPSCGYSALVSLHSPNDIHLYSLTSGTSNGVGRRVLQSVTLTVTITGDITTLYSGPSGNGTSVSGMSNAWGVPEGHAGNDCYGVYVEDACSLVLISEQGNGPKDRVAFASTTGQNKTIGVSSFDGGGFFNSLSVSTLTVATLILSGRLSAPLQYYLSTIAGLPSASPNNRYLYCSDLGGAGGLLGADGTNWRRVNQSGSSVNSTDADFTLTPLTNAPVQHVTATLTADRTCTLSTTRCYNGVRFYIVRSGADAFNLNVTSLSNVSGSTLALPAGSWAIVEGATTSAWKLVAAGKLAIPGTSLSAANNLSDLASVATARTNLHVAGLNIINLDGNSSIAIASGATALDITTLTATRSRNLTATGAVAGDRIKIKRTGGSTGGPFALNIKNIATTVLVAMNTGDKTEVLYDGSDWSLW